MLVIAVPGRDWNAKSVKTLWMQLFALMLSAYLIRKQLVTLSIREAH